MVWWGQLEHLLLDCFVLLIFISMVWHRTCQFFQFLSFFKTVSKLRSKHQWIKNFSISKLFSSLLHTFLYWAYKHIHMKRWLDTIILICILVWSFKLCPSGFALNSGNNSSHCFSGPGAEDSHVITLVSCFQKGPSITLWQFQLESQMKELERKEYLSGWNSPSINPTNAATGDEVLQKFQIEKNESYGCEIDIESKQFSAMTQQPLWLPRFRTEHS